MVEHYGIVGQLSGRALWDSGTVLWQSTMGWRDSSVVEHYGIVGQFSGRALWDSGTVLWQSTMG